MMAMPQRLLSIIFWNIRNEKEPHAQEFFCTCGFFLLLLHIMNLVFVFFKQCFIEFISTIHVNTMEHRRFDLLFHSRKQHAGIFKITTVVNHHIAFFWKQNASGACHLFGYRCCLIYHRFYRDLHYLHCYSFCSDDKRTGFWKSIGICRWKYRYLYLHLHEIYYCAPNVLIIGFIVAMITSTITIILTAGMFPTIVIPLTVTCFFENDCASIIENATGGIRGCIIGAILSGIIMVLLVGFGSYFFGNTIGNWMQVYVGQDFSLLGTVERLIARLL